MFHAQQCAENVGVEGGSVAFGRLLSHRARLPSVPAVFTAASKRPNRAMVFSTKLAYILFVDAHRTVQIRRSHQVCGVLNQLLAFFVASPRNNNAGAFLREGQCGGATNTSKRACDQNNLFFMRTSCSILKVIFVLS